MGQIVNGSCGLSHVCLELLSMHCRNCRYLKMYPRIGQSEVCDYQPQAELCTVPMSGNSACHGCSLLTMDSEKILPLEFLIAVHNI
jgi:hypothetical protein